MIAGEETRVLVPFTRGRTLRGEVAPAPPGGSDAHVRILTRSVVGASMMPRRADLASDGTFELHNAPAGDLELAVVILEPRRRGLRLHLFDVAGDEQDVLLPLEGVQELARYRLLETGPHPVGWLRITSVRGTILWQDNFTSHTLIELPAGEVRFEAAPLVRAGGVALYDLDRAIDAEIAAPGTGRVRDVICDFRD